MRNMKNIGVTENICKKLKTLGYTFQKEQDKREKKNTHTGFVSQMKYLNSFLTTPSTFDQSFYIKYAHIMYVHIIYVHINMPILNVSILSLFFLYISTLQITGDIVHAHIIHAYIKYVHIYMSILNMSIIHMPI